MKLSEHVNLIRKRITEAYDKQLALSGIGKIALRDISTLSTSNVYVRDRFYSIIQRHIGETGNYFSAREKLIDELTFTLFNQIAALKVMEASNLETPVISRSAEQGNKSFGHKLWLEKNPNKRSDALEGLYEYVQDAFNDVGKAIPLYKSENPYSLLPDIYDLNEIIDLFNSIEKDNQVGAEIWKSDDILGWLYESYNLVQREAFKDSKKKTEYDNVSLQSQVYTPRWVVQFLVENSLGKYYLEMYPDSPIQFKHNIVSIPKLACREKKALDEISIIDPACGSGNFLLFAFDFFYELYLDQINNYGASYLESDIAKLIIEKNLHGIDIDDRAVQLAQLGLYIKARKKQHSLPRLEFKVVSSDFYLPDFAEVKDIFESGNGSDEKLDYEQLKLIEDVWNDLRYAYKFGSLIHIDERLSGKLQALEDELKNSQSKLSTFFAVESDKKFTGSFFDLLKSVVLEYAPTSTNQLLTTKTHDAILFMELLSSKYDVTITNPPYTDSCNFGVALKSYINEIYNVPYKSNTNLYSAFIQRSFELTTSSGKLALIHPHTFMYLKTFEGVRNFILKKTHIDIFVDYGLDRINLFGPGILVNSTYYVLSKDISNNEGIFIDATTNTQEKYKMEIFKKCLSDIIENVDNPRVYRVNQNKFFDVSSQPFIYWISDEFRKKLSTYPLNNYANVCKGMDTSYNVKYIRYWWEVTNKSLKDDWKIYSKGGPFRKWYGNLWTVINWKDNGKDVKSFSKSTIRNEKYYFKEGITYSTATSKGASFRYLPPDSIFDASANGIFVKDENIVSNRYLLAFLNLSFSNYVRNCLNPTPSTTVGDLNRLPLIPQPNSEIIDKLTNENISLYQKLNSYSFYDLLFETTPISAFKKNDQNELIIDVIKGYLNYENYIQTYILMNESVLDKIIISAYNINDFDLSKLTARIGTRIGYLPIIAEAKNEFLLEQKMYKINLNETTINFIKNLPTIDSSAIHLDDIESDFPQLYLKNNEFEDFCIKHTVNPINVWYLFKHWDETPKARVHDLIFEFLTVMINTELQIDDDGIIPLTSNSGEKNLSEKLEEKLLSSNFSTAQYSQIETILEMSISEYLYKYYFKELANYLNFYAALPKTPFIWHLSSGPQHGFDCYVSIYKWGREKLLRLRNIYIEHRERSLTNKYIDLKNNSSVVAQHDREVIEKQLKEIEIFKKKIDELLEEGYDPKLNSGVAKNIAPLQKKKMLSYDVIKSCKAFNLDTFLNADW